MSMKFHSPLLEGEPFAVTPLSGITGGPVSVSLWGEPPSSNLTSFFAPAGRVVEPELPLASLEGAFLIERADGAQRILLTDFTAAQALTGTSVGGDNIIVNVQPIAQDLGWARGAHYDLRMSGSEYVIRPGRKHRKWYISGVPTALTRAQIAADAGVSESTVTAAWLLTRPQYGGSPETAVVEAIAKMFAATYTSGNGKEARSDWYLYERGYTYEGVLISEVGLKGESAVHPMVWGAWGSGARPVLRLNWGQYAAGPKNLVVFGLETTGFDLRNCKGVILHDIRVRGEGKAVGAYGLTLSRLDVSAFKLAPGNSRATWHFSEDRISGLYHSGWNLLIKDSLFDKCGWDENYNFNALWENGLYGQPPSNRSHCLYIDYHAFGVTVKDSIISRGAGGHGPMLRGGGHLMGNALLDNNIQSAMLGGDYQGRGPRGNFCLQMDNVAMSAGYREITWGGAVNWGLRDGGVNSSLVGNILSHRANPDNAAEVALKTNGISSPGSENGPPLSDDTRSYGWTPGLSLRVDGIPEATLDQTTFWRWAETVTGIPASDPDALAGFMDYVRTNGLNPGDLARQFVRWTQAAYGTPIYTRTTPTTIDFWPDIRADGFRSDNRLNLSTQDALIDGDSLRLNGAFMLFGGQTVTLASLRFDRGELEANNGALTVQALEDPATITLTNCCELTLPNTTQPVSIVADDGLALLGNISDLDLIAKRQAEVVLGSATTVPVGKTLEVDGGRAMVGWDGTGAKTLTIAGTLRLRIGVAATVQIPGDWQSMHAHMAQSKGIREVNGAWTAVEADSHRWLRHVSSPRDQMLWMCSVEGIPQVGNTINYLDHVTHQANPAPEMLGVPKITPQLAEITTVKLDIPKLQVFRSGALGDGVTEPTATAEIRLVPGSEVEITGMDLLTPGVHEWDWPGVTVVNNGATLPPGVTVTGGNLVLTIN